MAQLSKKKKNTIIIAVVLVVAIVVSCVLGVTLGNKGTAVQMQTIGLQDITTVINSTADVKAGGTKEYRVDTVATVKEVFVKVGDEVEKGDLIASFDTSEVDKQISNLQTQYNSQKNNYNKNLNSANQAKKDLANVEKEISALEKTIAELKKNQPTPPSSPQLPSEAAMKIVMERVQKAVTEYILSGGTSKDEITKIVSNVIDGAVKDGTITAAQGETMKKLINGGSIGDIANGADNATKLLSAEAKLSSLQMKKEVYSLMSNQTLAETSKTAMDTTKDLLDTMKAQRDALASGWKADFNGVITAVNIVPGGKTSLLQPGVVLEGTETMTAVFTLGKYDIQKVKVGMPCKITVVNGEYEGEVSYIAPTAKNNNAASNMLDSMASSIGISGLGSLTSAPEGLECHVTIKNPDEKVIIGLDCNVEIILGETNDVVAIPVEAIQMDKQGKYCYVYNEDKKTVEKRPVEVGESSDSYYEVKSGLKVGDRVITSELTAISTALENGDTMKVYPKTNN